jgi:hypothetical protein
VRYCSAEDYYLRPSGLFLSSSVFTFFSIFKRIC